MAEEEGGTLLYITPEGERGRTIIVKGDGDGRLDILANLRAVNQRGERIDLRADNQRLFRMRPYESRRVVTGNPFLINGAAGVVTVYTCPADTIAEVGIWIGSEGTTSGKIDINVGARRLLDDVLMPNNVPPLHVQGIRLTAAQTVTAASSQGVANVWIDVDEFSTGDTATGV